MGFSRIEDVMLAHKKKVFDIVQKKAKNFIKHVYPTLKEQGIEIRAVGGCVRDGLCGHTPTDIDFCTPALPETLMSLKIRNVDILPTGIDHGTVTFVVHDFDDGTELFEVTTLRTDIETDGRHAKVGFTNDWHKDAERRDFTVNAMSMDIETGEIFDYYNGLYHVRYNNLVFVGDATKRIEEDYLRMLRAARFCAKGFDLDLIGSIAIRNLQAKERMRDTISGERIWSEFKKLCDGRFAKKGLDTLFNADMFEYIHLPFWTNNNFIQSFFSVSLNSLLSCTTHKLIAQVDTHPGISKATILVAACIQNQEELDLLFSELKLSRKEYDFIQFILENKNPNNTKETYNRLLVDDVPLPFVLCLACIDNKNLEITDNKIATLQGMCANRPVFPIAGHNLIDIGFTPGPIVGDVLKKLKFYWKISNYTLTLAQLIKAAKQMLPVEASQNDK